ncbi:hypothetical protein, partial [Acidithiobacillus sp.]
MSTLVGKAYHPINGATEQVWEGFSWPCLLFGCVWYGYKGMWGWAFIALFLAVATAGVSWLILPFFANEQYAKHLLSRGYFNEKQWGERANTPMSGTISSEPNNVKTSAVSELEKLVALKE